MIGVNTRSEGGRVRDVGSLPAAGGAWRVSVWRADVLCGRHVVRVRPHGGAFALWSEPRAALCRPGTRARRGADRAGAGVSHDAARQLRAAGPELTRLSFPLTSEGLQDPSSLAAFLPCRVPPLSLASRPWLPIQIGRAHV